MGKIFEVHEVTKQNIKTLLRANSDDIIVFDDGLYSQFTFLDTINRIDCKKYFAISTGLVNSYPIQIITDRNEAMGRFKEKRDCSAYMTVEQIKEIENSSSQNNLCLHGHNHIKFEPYIKKHPKCLLYITKEYIEDFNKSLEGFLQNIREIPTSYCFPYNFTGNGYFESIIKEKYPLITTIFGPGRVSI